MKFYALTGYEENTTLIHDKEFTDEEFQRMCKEAPLTDCGTHSTYDTFNIIEYLVNKYNFKEVEYQTSFCVDD